MRTPVAALVVVPGLLLLGCAVRLPVERPVRVFEAQRTVSIQITSEPSGAEVFRLKGPEEAARELLGTTPIEVALLTVQKELWKHEPRSQPPASGSPHVALGDHQDNEGDGYSERFLLVHPGHSPRKVQVSLPVVDLPALFRAGRHVEHVDLEVAP